MIPIESIEKDRLAIVGTSGSGKSYLAMSLVEQLMAMGRRVVVVDPLGAWFGLRLLPPSIGKMLKAIADGNQDKATIASVAGISPTSSGLGSGLRELVDLELIVADGGNYTLAEGL